MLKALAIFLFLFTVSVSPYAQIPQAPVTIATPNAASLGLFGEVPVSQFTGLPSISVPIYSFTERKLSVPIQLNYHASGFRPDAHPGWVGMGWDLSVGVITRIVKDVPDDYHNPIYPYYGTNAGFYYNYGVLNAPNWNQISYLKSIAQNTNSLIDTEPDEFAFNAPGLSGKFYLDHTRNWKVKCNRPVKVTFNNQFLNIPFTAPMGSRIYSYGNSKAFAGFTITDDLGNQYVFGGNNTALDYSIGFFSQYTDEWFADAWYLTKMISADGYEINLTYERGDFINQMYISLYHNRQVRTQNSGGIFNPQPACSSSPEYYPIFNAYGGKLLSPVYLRSISTSNSTIDFKSSESTELRYDNSAYAFKRIGSPYNIPFLPFLTNDANDYPGCLDKLKWRKLDTIIVSEGNNRVRTFLFNYNNQPDQRLKLTSVFEMGKNGSIKPPYRFFYDESMPLPPYLANKTDHWGFYNGLYADISNENTYINTYYSYREPVAEYLFAGTLNRVIYPTGGATDFIYEPHTYSKRLQFQRSNGIDPSFNSNTMAGGLRIKKIISYDSIAATGKSTKEYFYVSNYTNSANINNLKSSGVLGGQIKYYFDDYRLEAFNDNGVVHSKSVFSSQSVLPACNNSQGSHVGYSEVTEKRSDGGYTRYFFTNFENGHIDEATPSIQLTRTAYEPYTSLEEERGLLWKEENYDNTNRLLKKRSIAYEAIDKDNQFVRSMSARHFNVCPGTAISVAEGNAYKIYTYSYLPVLETDSLFSTDVNGGAVVKIKINKYDPTSRLLKEVSTLDSKGDTLKTVMTYPTDYPTSGVYAGMVNKNLISPVIETSILRATQSGSTRISLERTNFFSPSAGRYYPQTIEFQAGNQPIVTRAHYHSYDNWGNLLEATMENGLKMSYLWGYNGRFPVAKVTGCDVATINSLVNQATLDNSVTTDALMRTELNKVRVGLAGTPALVSTYTHLPLIGLNSETDPAGRSTFFEFDGLGQLMSIKDMDGNIVRNYQYAYQTFSHGNPVWYSTGRTRCKPCPENPAFWINIEQKEEYDVNQNSTTYNQKRWVDLTTRNICEFVHYWQNTSTALRCRKVSGANTGEQEQEQRDMSPCSPTYNQTRWVVVNTNTTACPIPN